MSELPSIAERAVASAWARAEPGLPETAADLERELGRGREHLVEQAELLAQPGPPSPTRALRHATALSVHRMIRTGTRLPGDLRSGAPFRDTQRWAREASAEAFADQLALGGAPTAEVARLIVAADGLFPQVLTDELAGRTIRTAPVPATQVAEIAHRSFGEHLVVERDPMTGTPVSQLHPGLLHGREVAVRVRRPGIARGVRDDTRLVATLVAPLQRAFPQVSAVHPLGFVELTIRQGLESTDMRYEALNLLELGLVAEDLGVAGLTIARPVPGYVTRHALVTERLAGLPLADAEVQPDPTSSLQALTSITLESALVHGIFWADPAPEHLLVAPDGTLAIVGTGTVGHLPPDLKVAGIKFLRSFLSGDHEGQVEAMTAAGAVPPDADLDGLLAELQAAEALQLTAILMGGERGLLAGLNEAVRILLQYRLRPPLEVTLLLRTVFALGALSERLAPDGGGLAMAVLPLVQRLPDLLAQAEADDP